MTDTDSLTICYSRENIRDCVKPECLELFDREKDLYLVDPTKPEMKRQPGLFKVLLNSYRYYVIT